MRILIADDDPATRFMLEDAVSEWGYEAVVATDGQQAYDILSGQDALQLALLDWMMPGMYGPEICYKIRQMKGLPFIYMIILTSKTEKKDLAAALEAGADDFLSKPVDNDELKSRLAVGVRAVQYEQALIEKNKQLDEYANRMEALAEERAKQLVHAERLAVLGTLTAGIAHEIANPLTAVAGIVSLLDMDWKVAEPCIRDALRRGVEDEERLTRVLQGTPKLLDDAMSATDRAIRFLQNLKGFSRKDHDLLATCSINKCIEIALRLGSHSLKNGIRIEEDLAEDLPSLRANPLQLEQVFLNLFINAADAMAASGGGTLGIVSRQVDDKLAVIVEDTGCGISEDKLQTIWEPFFTTKNMDKGTGLGLSISRGIVEDHKGTIRAENKPDGGARFIVELPISVTPRP